MKNTYKMPEKEKTFILIAGANASGKSSVIKPKHVAGRVEYYFDPDRFEDDPDFSHVTEKEILTSKALEYRERDLPSRFAIECIDNLFMPENKHIRNKGFATESNLVTSRDFEKFREAKEYGMKTELYFVYVPLETVIQRERIRAAKGEQKKIDLDRLIRRYDNGLSNIQPHIDSGNIDVIKIYDNSLGKGEEQLILHIEYGRTVYLHPEPPEWFKDAGIKIFHPNNG